ncbi:MULTISPECIES: hypothetical protein [unclassified Nostoc]|nr:hypothetical protein [Nostoc sp. DedQUE03]MDZ7977196.1 hypothetical protein [Nostoc sp. DedQUE03]MDZ8042724.1 hypothetical protein [Nostoc sp. DedQUE02]
MNLFTVENQKFLVEPSEFLIGSSEMSLFTVENQRFLVEPSDS